MPTQIWIFQPELLTNSEKKLLEKLENKSIKIFFYKFANLEPVSSKILFVMLQGRHHPLQRRSAEQLAECYQKCAQVPADAGFSSALREGIVAGIIFHQIEPVFRIQVLLSGSDFFLSPDRKNCGSGSRPIKKRPKLESTSRKKVFQNTFNTQHCSFMVRFLQNLIKEYPLEFRPHMFVKKIY